MSQATGLSHLHGIWGGVSAASAHPNDTLLLSPFLSSFIFFHCFSIVLSHVLLLEHKTCSPPPLPTHTSRRLSWVHPPAVMILLDNHLLLPSPNVWPPVQVVVYLAHHITPHPPLKKGDGVGQWFILHTSLRVSGRVVGQLGMEGEGRLTLGKTGSGVRLQGLMVT
jgi:hypothetical protein